MNRVALFREPGPRRILALGAHADDIEIGCGGTLLRLVAEQQPLEVKWVVFCATPERAREAHASAAAFLEGVERREVVVKDFRDGYLPYLGAAVKDAFEELKRGFEPDLVFTHHRDDRHQDHRLVSELTWNTWRDHLVLEYEIPKYEGDLGTPNVFVPLSTAQANRKVELLMQHFATQRSRGWFRPSTFEGIMSIRGIECHAPDGRAEAFYARKIVL